MERLGALTFKLETYTPELARRNYGFLIKEILDRFFDKTKEPESDRKMYIYSGHDTTISGVLNILGLFEEVGKLINFFHCIKELLFLNFQPIPPPYCATLLFELRDFENNVFVQLFYKNDTHSNEAHLMEIPNCGYSCPLNKMYTLYGKFLPKFNADYECNNWDG